MVLCLLPGFSVRARAASTRCSFLACVCVSAGFDGLGLRFNGSGQFGEWWSDEALMQFRSRSTCLAKQYSKYQVRMWLIA